MKDKIKKILQDYMLTDLTLNDAIQQVLYLFSVSGSTFDEFGQKVKLPNELLNSTDECRICRYTEQSDKEAPCNPCKLDMGEYYR